MRTLHQEGAERQRLGGRPIDSVSLLHRLSAGFEHPSELGVHVDVVRNPRQGSADGLQNRQIHGRVVVLALLLPLETRKPLPLTFEPIQLLQPVVRGRIELRFEMGAEVGVDRIRLLPR